MRVEISRKKMLEIVRKFADKTAENFHFGIDSRDRDNLMLRISSGNYPFDSVRIEWKKSYENISKCLIEKVRYIHGESIVKTEEVKIEELMEVLE